MTSTLETGTVTPEVIEPRAPAQQPGPRPRTSALDLTALILAGLAGWLLLYALVLSGVVASRTQANLYDHLRSDLANEVTPIGGVIAPGTPLGLIQAPAIGIHDLVFTEGTSSRDLQAGPGHLANSPLPGQAGTAVLEGKSVTFGAPFRRLSQLHVGDLIGVTTGQGTYSYRVDAVLRQGDVIPAAVLTAGAHLSLYTSEGSGWQSGWAPDHTVRVSATLQGQLVPAPPGRPTAVAQSDTLMSSDTSTLVALLLWMQGLVVVVAAITWGMVRWRRQSTLLVGVPALLACLFGATTAAAALLPNLV